MTIIGKVTVLWMTIIQMTNDLRRDGGHPVDRLEDFDHITEVALSVYGDHPRESGCLRDFYQVFELLKQLKITAAKKNR